MAVHYFAGDPRNQFHMTPNVLDWVARNYRMTRIGANEAEWMYEYTNHIDVTHTVVITAWDRDAIETIEDGQRYQDMCQYWW